MVRLKVYTSRTATPALLRFNSNMVRLKAFLYFHVYFYTLQFQFQYGSIKRQALLFADKEYYTFQFQYGSIKRRYRIAPALHFSKFQFQYGSIKR